MTKLMNNYSPNMLKTFDECQQKFFLKYIQKLSVPQRSAIFEKGKKIHAFANYYLKGENIEKLEKVLTQDEKNAWAALKSSKYFKLNVVNTEYNLSSKIGKYWVGGRLDAFMSDGESYFILDYKTGNIPQNAEQDFQTIVYLLCSDKFLKKKGGSRSESESACEKQAEQDELNDSDVRVCDNKLHRSKKGGYNSLKFVYLGLKNDTEKEILLSDELKKQYEAKIISTCQKIDFAVGSNIFGKNKERCKNCEYKKLCCVEGAKEGVNL